MDNVFNIIPNNFFNPLSSNYLRKFASKDVAWIEEEFDDSTFEKYIVITEQGILLAELLTRLEKTEWEELSSYMYNIYNTLLNQEQWKRSPKSIFKKSNKAVFENTAWK